jgi:hypothetical protein
MQQGSAITDSWDSWILFSFVVNSMEGLFEGFLWGVAGFVAFLLARAGDRRWIVGAVLTALAATAYDFIGLSLLWWPMPDPYKSTTALLSVAVSPIVKGVPAFMGFAIARVLLRNRLYARRAESN